MKTHLHSVSHTYQESKYLQWSFGRQNYFSQNILKTWARYALTHSFSSTGDAQGSFRKEKQTRTIKIRKTVHLFGEAHFCSCAEHRNNVKNKHLVNHETKSKTRSAEIYFRYPESYGTLPARRSSYQAVQCSSPGFSCPTYLQAVLKASIKRNTDTTPQTHPASGQAENGNWKDRLK